MGVIRITIVSFLASLVIEITQLVTKLGSCDVDDIIMNTLGAFWAIFCLLSAVQFTVPI